MPVPPPPHTHRVPCKGVSSICYDLGVWFVLKDLCAGSLVPSMFILKGGGILGGRASYKVVEPCSHRPCSQKRLTMAL